MLYHSFTLVAWHTLLRETNMPSPVKATHVSPHPRARNAAAGLCTQPGFHATILYSAPQTASEPLIYTIFYFFSDIMSQTQRIPSRKPHIEIRSRQYTLGTISWPILKKN